MEQMETWLRTGACQYVGRWSEFEKAPDMKLVNTVLPLSIERQKPRICCDGGCLKAISPNKIPCELDEVSKAIKLCKKDALFCKFDDANGNFSLQLFFLPFQLRFSNVFIKSLVS